MATYRILSLDCGGIRGIIPALVLTELERRAGRPTAELFDLIAGTSTGGILALGLTRPGPEGKPAYGAREMVSLYERDGSRIFNRSIWHRVKAIGNLADEEYPSEGITTVLDARFGETMLSDADDVVMLSLGTGEYTLNDDMDDASDDNRRELTAVAWPLRRS